MALRDQPYFPLYVDDFLTDEKLNECSAESIGVYIKIMCLMHKQKEYGTILLKQKDKQKSSVYDNFAMKLIKHLPFNEEVIKKSIKELVDEDVLQINGDCLSQKRMIKDNKISMIRAKSGRIGGKKTQQKKDEFALVNNQAKMQANDKANSVNEYVHENVHEDKDNNKPISKYNKEAEKRFEDIWSRYPRKNNKKMAKKHFLASVKTDQDWEDINRALDNYIDYIVKKKVEIQYIKGGSTWFNNWRDSLEEWKDYKKLITENIPRSGEGDMTDGLS